VDGGEVNDVRESFWLDEMSENMRFAGRRVNYGTSESDDN